MRADIACAANYESFALLLHYRRPSVFLPIANRRANPIVHCRANQPLTVVLVTAATLDVACKLDDSNAMERSGDGSLRIPFNVTGNPAMALPAGFTRNGLPLSMQLVERLDEEYMVYRVALAYEAATKWYQRRPPNY